jgi:hypothetical protein
MSQPAFRGAWRDRSQDAEPVAREVRRYRFALLAALALAAHRQDALSDVARGFGRIAGMSREDRDHALADPAFLIWQDRLIVQLRREPGDLVALREQAGMLEPLLRRIARRREGRDGAPIGSTGILLQRAELDPLIQQVTPPTFDFEALRRSGPDPVRPEATRRFAGQVAEAFGNIRACDPDRYAALLRLIRVIGHLPDGESRSCSAARYAGVVYLAGEEESLLDLEESIVHEGAHQLLYKIAELTPLTERGAEAREFELPWSGSRRDLFGYLHACFIYVEIVKYYDRRAPTCGVSRAHAERVRQLIHRGLEMAVEDIRGAEGFTAAGLRIFAEVAEDVAALRRPTPVMA